MANFFINAYAKNGAQAISLYNKISGFGKNPYVEIWTIKPDCYGNYFIIITKRTHQGRTPKIKFIKRLR